MNKDELHRFFYANVIARLKGVVDEYGDNVDSVMGSSDWFRLYQSRPSRFNHNYLRDRFLENRDIYIACIVASEAIHILTEKVATGEVIIFRENLYKIFPGHKELALETLKELLDKFFTVRVRAKSTVVKFDSSQSGRTGSHGRFTRV